MTDRQILFRFPEELISKLDRHVDRMKRRAPGARVTRSDAVRTLLHAALEAEEREEAREETKE